jgi:hypothetical protein
VVAVIPVLAAAEVVVDAVTAASVDRTAANSGDSLRTCAALLF